MEDLDSYVITKYATDWYTIGIELKADIHKLDTIKQDHPQQSIVCFEKILNQWLQSNSDDVTWRTLEVALTNVNRANLGLKSVDVNGKDIFVIVHVNMLMCNPGLKLGQVIQIIRVKQVTLCGSDPVYEISGSNLDSALNHMQ